MSQKNIGLFFNEICKNEKLQNEINEVLGGTNGENEKSSILIDITKKIPAIVFTAITSFNVLTSTVSISSFAAPSNIIAANHTESKKVPETLKEIKDTNNLEEKRKASIISIEKSDITKMKIDLVVNAANSRLAGGGGVDGAIHKAAGPNLIKYLKENYPKGCPTGDFKPSPAFNMPCKEILHAVGPIGEKPLELSSVYSKCLQYAKEKGYRSIAFPCISTGIYGYKNEKACPVVLDTVRKWLDVNSDWNGQIIFCCYSQNDTDIYHNNVNKFFPQFKK